MVRCLLEPLQFLWWNYHQNAPGLWPNKGKELWSSNILGLRCLASNKHNTLFPTGQDSSLWNVLLLIPIDLSFIKNHWWQYRANVVVISAIGKVANLMQTHHFLFLWPWKFWTEQMWSWQNPDWNCPLLEAGTYLGNIPFHCLNTSIMVHWNPVVFAVSSVLIYAMTTFGVNQIPWLMINTTCSFC